MVDHIKRLQVFGPYFFIFLFLVVVLSGVFLPLYSDEAVGVWNLAGIIDNQGGVFNLLPQCSNGSLYKINFLFYPAAILYFLVYAGLDPIGMRISGILVALLWLLTLWSISRELIKNNKISALVFSVLLAFLMMGVLPYIIIVARPEQVIVLYVTILSVLCLYRRKLYIGWRYAVLLVTFFLVCSSFLYIHPKALFFSPLMVFGAVCITSEKNRLVRLVFILITACLVYTAFQLWASILTCDIAPAVSAIVKSNTLSLNILIQSPVSFFMQGVLSIIEAPDKIISHVLFKDLYQSGWLPPVPSTISAYYTVNSYIKELLYLLLVVSHLGTVIIFVIRAILRQLSAQIWLGLMIVVGELATAFFYKSWNFYSGAQYIPISILLVIMWLPAYKERVAPLAIKLVCLLICLFSCFSMTLLVSRYLPSMIHNSNLIAADIPNQPLSIPIFSAHEQLGVIRELAQQCKVTGDGSKNLVVDHMSYYAFRNLRTPIHVLYISGWLGGDLTGGKLEQFLKKLESPGVISRCSYLPEQLRGRKHAELGGYCCVDLQPGR